MSRAANGREPGPLWAGAAPPLADGFVARPESGDAVMAALVPGATVVLTSGRAAVTTATADWRRPTGKTQLAVATALSLWESGDVEVLAWISATSRASVLSTYADAVAALEGQSLGGQSLGGQPPDDAGAAAARFAGWLRETARPWLVVIDDLTAGAVPEELWPLGPAGRVLVTTGRTAVGTVSGAGGRVGGGSGGVSSGSGGVSSGSGGVGSVAGVSRQARGTVIALGPFSRREALTYLMGRLKADVGQRQGAADLVSDLHDEPLALAQASAVIASSELTCHDYGQLVARNRSQVAGDHPAPAATTWAISVEHVDLLSPGDAQPVLVRAALLDANGIPATVFGDEQARTELAALAQAGLLTVSEDTTPPLARMNRVVQAAVRAAMPDGMLGIAASATASALVRAWPEDDQPEWLARAFRSCAASLRTAADGYLWNVGGSVHELLLRTGHSLDASRLTESAVGYWEDLAAASAARLGPEHPDTLLLRGRLARADLAAGRTNESIDWFERIRSDRSRVLGPYHSETADASHDLGRALLAAGRARDAVGVLADALGGYERAKGPASIEAMTTREDLAAACRATGQLDEAIAMYRRALSDRERMQGKRHRDTLGTSRGLADALLAAGQPKPAITLYKRVLDGSARALGTAHPDTVAIKDSLATAYYGAGRLASAISLYEQVREDYLRTLGPDHERALSTSVNLAHSYYTVGRLTDATRLLRETVERCDLTRPATDPLARTARESLANITGD